MSEEESPEILHENTPKPLRKRIKDVDLNKVSRKMQMILEREVDRLVEESRLAALSESSHKKILNYLKLLPEIIQLEVDSMEHMTDEDLEKLSQPTPKKGDNHGQND